MAGTAKVKTGGRTAKAKAGALAGGITGPGAGYLVLLAINEVIPDAPWEARGLLFLFVAAVVGYLTVYWAPRNAEPGPSDDDAA